MTRHLEPAATCGERVRALRRARGWTQADFAARLAAHGVSLRQTTVAKLESGLRPTPVGEVLPIARLFDVAPGDLFGEPPTHPADQRVERRKRLTARLRAAQARLGELERQLSDARAEEAAARQQLVNFEARQS